MFEEIFYSGAGVIIVILLVVYLFIFFGFIVMYVIRGIALSTIARRMGKELPWLAWIPYARTYLHGDLAGSITLKKKTITQPGIWLIVLPLVGGIIFMIWYFVFIFSTVMSLAWNPDFVVNPYSPPTGMIITMIFSLVLMVIGMVVYQGVFYVLKMLVNNKIFGQFTTSNMAIAHSVLAIFVPMYETICLFVMRNKEFLPATPSISSKMPSVTPWVSPEISSGMPSVNSNEYQVSPEVPSSHPSTASHESPVSPEVPKKTSSTSGTDWL